MRHHHESSERGRGRGRGRGSGRDIPADIDINAVRAWLQGRLPDDWFQDSPDLSVDREEIIIVGTIDEPAYDEDASDDARAAAQSGRITKFREDTREQRIKVALELESRTGRKIGWGAQSGDTRSVFTTISVPVMTRLRQSERQILDTLVDAGVARSRSEAVAWCVQLVGEHTDDWLSEIREALAKVEEVRAKGPGV